MIRHISIGVIGILLLLIFTSGCIISAQNTTQLEPVPAEQINSMDAALYPLTYLIAKDMEQACCLVGKTARELDGVPTDDPAVELTLLKLRRDIPFSFEAGLFDKNDTLIASTEDRGKTMEIGVGKATHHYTEEELKAAGPRRPGPVAKSTGGYLDGAARLTDLCRVHLGGICHQRDR